MRALRLIHRFRRSEDGTSSVEFVILMPLVFAIFVAALESGLMMVRWTSIDRASDMVIRQLRLGQLANPTARLLREEGERHAGELAPRHQHRRAVRHGGRHRPPRLYRYDATVELADGVTREFIQSKTGVPLL